MDEDEVSSYLFVKVAWRNVEKFGLNINKILNRVYFKDFFLKIIFDWAIAWYTCVNVNILQIVTAVILHLFFSVGRYSNPDVCYSWWKRW